MDNLALIESFAEFKDDKNIDRENLMAIIEDSIRGVLKKQYGSADNYDIIVNPDKGDLEIWRNRIVVEDGFSEDDNLEIELAEARLIEPDFEVGEEVSEEVKLEDLGRRAILALSQNLRGKVMEHDSAEIYRTYKDQVGEIINGEVHFAKKNFAVIFDEAQNEMVLPKDQQIAGDFFRKGDSIRAVIEDVELKGSKPFIKISRTSPKFLEKLFEQEIPEIADGLIIIKNVVRIPGEKAKVAVESYDDRIDPVGACVGMKGSRIHGIVRELRNENIDVINYTTNTQLYISRALSPAKVSSMEIDEATKTAKVFLHPDEVSKAIGRGGNNIRLAGQLTGYEINVFRDVQDEDVELSEFSDEIEPWIIAEFERVGLDTAKAILELNVTEIVRRTDLEEETVQEVLNILREEFED